ncbi:RNase adapter RapZ [Parasphingopyxis sp.]|uniref:RNase adapter RapZ n=1 Tax=Parasphingopyxis sp. TaxID=1920299 RepID=UPI002628D3DB|nr:RNase adapter RapZ [Parasphingopyxis sp.]
MSETVSPERRILLVTGMSGAGKSTALRTLEDMGWETVDNLPLSLFEKLFEPAGPLDPAKADRSIAIGIDSRTRGFDANAIVERIKHLKEERSLDIETLFLDCTDSELERRFSETRRRHPLALDRPAAHGIALERDLMTPLRRWAAHLVDTTDSAVNELQKDIRSRFGSAENDELVITVVSFGFARGILRNADLLFDMRFLRNPHWDDTLRAQTGLDAAVGDYIAKDEAYDEALHRIEELAILLLPRYQAEGKSYVTIGFGCTGGRHRSVHVAERVGERLREAGFSPTVSHRDLAFPSLDSVERVAAGENGTVGE